MPAHIFQRTGNYGAAATANVHGANADREFIRKYGQSNIYSMMYYNHNLHFGAYSYAMAGRYADAKKLADEVGAAATAMAKEMSFVEPIAATPYLIRLRFGRWAEVLRAPDPAVGPISTAFWHFARGVAFARLGNTAGAESEKAAFEKAAPAVPESSMMFQNSPKALMEVAAQVLAGRIAEARGQPAAAIAAYRRAAQLEDALGYNEPADWFYPVRETLGAALLRDGQADEAADVFQADLDRNPNNPRSLYGLAEALSRNGKKKEAADARARYHVAWKGADSKLSLSDL
jgi:tetratricopeptide (TPR) repeat protein